ncbi:hypothetical protein B566_EDAN016245 [Ephemera danica]|nr:hypothetical protein B566_EDAN016245 [Ephemera danica]
MNRVDLKIVLLGHEFVGKTSLLDRYIHDRFKGAASAYQNTIGAAFAARQVAAKGKKFIVGIWDTAGSERYEAMSRMYYRGAKAAVVCFDVSDIASWTRAKFWVQELRRYEEECRIYLCGTKVDCLSDGTAQREIEYDLAYQYAEGIQGCYMETSSKTGKNVAELFQRIADDFIREPENERQVEETFRLAEHEKRRRCC